MRKKKFIAHSLAIGIILHLLLDLPEVPLFSPFIYYEYEIIEDPIGYWINKLLTEPVVQITEVLGLFGLAFILFHNKLFNFKMIHDYLLQNNIKSKALVI